MTSRRRCSGTSWSPSARSSATVPPVAGSCHVHWDLPLPRPNDPVEQQLEVLRTTRDILALRIADVLALEPSAPPAAEGAVVTKIADELPIGVMARRSDGRIIYFNREAEVLTGRCRSEVMGRVCRDLWRDHPLCAGACESCGSPAPRQAWVRDHRGTRRLLRVRTRQLERDEAAGLALTLMCFEQIEQRRAEPGVEGQRCGELVGRSASMLALFRQIREVGPTCASVLIQGESGTGKELVARAIHDHSGRASQPFIAINCGALPEGLLESELFGHVKGAFTGAVRDQMGLLERAHRGTLFLDEIGEIPPALQVKLLRVLQERKFEPVGSARTVSVDIRIVAATNQDLEKLIEHRRFRRDLFFRLCVFPIDLDPLHRRREDIPLLAEHLLDQVAQETSRSPLTISREALDTLVAHRWPGNVRELRNAIEYCYIRCREDQITLEHLPRTMTAQRRQVTRRRGPRQKLSRPQVIEALEQCRGRREAAAERLGVSRSTLYRFIKKNNLSDL